MIKRIYQFLASARFAMIILFFLALFAIFGTFVEGISGSHEKALRDCYQHPLFLALLFGLFINILLAALNRWPWKRSHLPFLMAHLGLLMVILGTFFKAIEGIQGTITLLEGTCTNQMLLPHTYAISLENENGRFQIPLTSSMQAALENKIEDVTLKILAYYPHSTSKLFFLKDPLGWRIDGLAPIPFHAPPLSVELFPEQLWMVSARSGNQINQLLRDSYIRATTIHLMSGEHTDHPTTSVPLKVLLNQGITTSWGDLKAKLTLTCSKDVAFLEIFDPDGHTCRVELSKCDGPLMKECSFPYAMHVSFERPCELLLLESENGQEQLVCVFGPYGAVQLYSPLFEEFPLFASNNPDFSNHCLRLDVPLAFMQPPRPATQTTSDKKECVFLFLPVVCRAAALPLPKRSEDRRPAIQLKLCKDSYSEALWLNYDPSGCEIGWPSLQGKFLVRFQPKVASLPYQIRLREGRKINYPNSSQPLSYECDLSIKQNGQAEGLVTLAMNHVHQTSDGYRFCLANLSDISPFKAKHVQLCVHRDIFRYWLTYPGGFFVVCGAILLYLQKMGRKRS